MYGRVALTVIGGMPGSDIGVVTGMPGGGVGVYIAMGVDTGMPAGGVGMLYIDMDVDKATPNGVVDIGTPGVNIGVDAGMPGILGCITAAEKNSDQI